MRNTRRKRAIIAALTDFSHESLHKFGPPPMSATLISKIIGESEKLSSVCQTLQKLTRDGVLISECKPQEVSFCRNNIVGVQIKKVMVYWNAETVDSDRQQALQWIKSC